MSEWPNRRASLRKQLKDIQYPPCTSTYPDPPATRPLTGGDLRRAMTTPMRVADTAWYNLLRPFQGPPEEGFLK